MFNDYKQAPNQGPTFQNQLPPYTNGLFVDNLEQALKMPARFHSEMNYFDKHQDLLYRIYTDQYGGKRYMILQLSKFVNEPVEQKPIEEKQELSPEERLSKIEKFMEDFINGKFNVNTNVSTEQTGTTATANATE